MILENSVDIKRSPDDVFGYCSDLRVELEWNPDLKSVQMLTDGPVGVGTRYRAEWASGGGPMVIECVRWEPFTGWATTGGSKRLTINFQGTVVPIADGARLVVRMELLAHGMTRLMMPILRRVMQRGEQRNLAAIKSKLEA